jgi:predicted amidohydrolase
MAKMVRVSTIAWSAGSAGCKSLDECHEKLSTLLDQAGRAQPDLVALTEFVNVYNGPDSPAQAQTVPGPTTELCAEAARKYNTYIVCNLPTREGETLHNTSVFIDRKGDVVGQYHKYQPTIGEMEKGTRPGVDAYGFDLDFGRVGAAICFDMKFIEVGQSLAAKRCRLCVFSSMFIAGQRLQHWARDFGIYVISSVPARSYVVDMSGRILTETGQEINQVRAGYVLPIASAVINMDRMLFHLDYNQTKFADMQAKYGPGIEIEVHYPEAHCTIASNLPDVTIEDLIAEYELEPWLDYLDRARGVRRNVLSGS